MLTIKKQNVTVEIHSDIHYRVVIDNNGKESIMNFGGVSAWLCANRFANDGLAAAGHKEMFNL